MAVDHQDAHSADVGLASIPPERTGANVIRRGPV
jgi:hypothetical protein